MFVPQRLEDTVPAIAQEQVVMILFDFATGSFSTSSARCISMLATARLASWFRHPRSPPGARAKSPFPNLTKDYPFERRRAFSGGRSVGASVKARRAAPRPRFRCQRAASENSPPSSWPPRSPRRSRNGWRTTSFGSPPTARHGSTTTSSSASSTSRFATTRPRRRAPQRRATGSETVRISFSTPHPYYPYLEPAGSRSMPRRLLQVWLVTDEPMRPVAARELKAG